MDVHKSSLLAVFDSKQRLEVPLFQRQYVWNEEQQWLPLWEDIERKFTEALDDRKDAPNHFLGSMVLDQKQTPTGHVVVRQVIDGQQRLTTLQIFLSAYRDFCQEHSCTDIANECEKFLFNTGMMSDPKVDTFKVWPTQLDRPQFVDVLTSGSRNEVIKGHPLKKKPYGFSSKVQTICLAISAPSRSLVAANDSLRSRIELTTMWLTISLILASSSWNFPLFIVVSSSRL